MTPPRMRCQRLSCSMRVTACALRWTMAAAGQHTAYSDGPDSDGRLASCRGCAVGAESAAAWPVVLETSKSPARFRRPVRMVAV